MRLAGPVLAAALALGHGRAFALGEVITDIRVENAARTEEETVRSIAGISIGDVLEVDTLEKARERLHTSGLFADVNVYWEAWRDGVRVNIIIKDKFPWAPVPTFSRSPGNTSAGLVIGHGNLFGRGKRGVIGIRLSTVDSGALVAYEDPALLGSWLFWNLRGKFQDQIVPEYGNVGLVEPPTPIRETKLRSVSGEVNLGMAWFRKVKTSVGWFLDLTDVRWSRVDPSAPAIVGDAAEDLVRGIGQANLTFDFRGREHAVMYGNALSFSIDYALPDFGSDARVRYWKAWSTFEQGIRFFRKHNLILRAGASAGKDLPFWAENSTSGSNLRGFLYRQFMGDTQLRTQVEYHFPLFSIMQLDVRGLLFNDAAATWYRELPPEFGSAYETHPNGRSYLPPSLLQPGFDMNRDIHTSVGAGIRFYLRTVSAPLVGIDVGHGIDTGTIRMLIVIGV